MLPDYESTAPKPRGTLHERMTRDTWVRRAKYAAFVRSVR